MCSRKTPARANVCMNFFFFTSSLLSYESMNNRQSWSKHSYYNPTNRLVVFFVYVEITDVFLLEPLYWKREFAKLHFIRQDKILNVHTLNLSGLTTWSLPLTIQDSFSACFIRQSNVVHSFSPVE